MAGTGTKLGGSNKRGGGLSLKTDVKMDKLKGSGKASGAARKRV